MKKARKEEIMEWCITFENIFHDFLNECPKENRFKKLADVFMDNFKVINQEKNRITKSRKFKALEIVHTRYFWRENPYLKLFSKGQEEGVRHFIIESFKESIKGITQSQGDKKC